MGDLLAAPEYFSMFAAFAVTASGLYYRSVDVSVKIATQIGLEAATVTILIVAGFKAPKIQKVEITTPETATKDVEMNEIYQW